MKTLTLALLAITTSAPAPVLAEYEPDINKLCGLYGVGVEIKHGFAVCEHWKTKDRYKVKL
jgi:hypothetical protein